MIIANQLKDRNRAEYLLYMWQVEDLIRAFGCDEDRICREYVSQFKLDDKERKETEEWYRNLCEMMRTEGVKEHGHLQICKNILQQLEELNHQLLESQHFPYFRQMYYKVLPYIVELRHKQNPDGDGSEVEESELSTCFDALYGVMLLRLQKKEVTADTERAVKEISTYLGQLSDYYFKDKKEPLEF